MFKAIVVFVYAFLSLLSSTLASPQPPGGFGPGSSGCNPFNTASCTTTTTSISSASTSTSTSTSSLVNSTPILASSGSAYGSSESPSFIATPSASTGDGSGGSSPSPSASSLHGSNGLGPSSIGSGSGSSNNSPSGGTGSPYGGGAGGGANSGFSLSSLPIFSKLNAVLIAHAVLACLAWALFFPLGAIIIRVLRSRHLVWLHAALQIFAYAMFTAAVGLGIWLAKQFDQYADLWHDPHVIIGLVVFALAFFQPILGGVHHHIFKTKGVGRRTIYAYAHLWLGRALITLGIINGGLGLRLAGKGQMQSQETTRRAEIAYGVLAGLAWLVYVAVMVWAELPRKGGDGSRRGSGVGPQMWVRTSHLQGNQRKSIDAL